LTVTGLPIGYASAQTVRKLVPGVLTVIPPEPKEEETFQGPLPLPALTQYQWTPSYTPKTYTLSEMASAVTIRHNVWCLEFAFKPLRMVTVDVPQPTGKMQQKLVWYLVYRVRNLGQHLTPVAVRLPSEVPDDKRPKHHVTYGTDRADEVLNVGAAQPSGSIRFFPQFVLDSREVNKQYLDRIIPVAIPVIQMREMRGSKLYNSVEISSLGIPVSQDPNQGAVWGVATWQDVDPNIDFFSIYIQGLTNAFRLVRGQDGKVVYQMKTLQMNFWRPGDAVFEHEKEVRYGVPARSDPAEQARILSQFGLQQRLDYLWVYR
jgi:hypothetical protein